MPLYLGIDAARNVAAAILIEIEGQTRRIVFTQGARYDDDVTPALDMLLRELAMSAQIDTDAIHSFAISDESVPAARRRLVDLGYLSREWQHRFDLPRLKLVTPPAELSCRAIGLGAVSDSVVAFWLGTNDVVMTRSARTTFRNGALARDWMRRQYALDWNAVAALLEDSPGNGGCVMLPWLELEVTPEIRHAGVRRFGFDAHDEERNVRGLIEGQMMAAANHLAGASPPLQRIVATGADAANRALLQVMANVFGCDVYRLDLEHPAALGAAISAYHADRLAEDEPVTWQTAAAGFSDPQPGHRVTPHPRHVAIYADLRGKYAMLERLHKDRRVIC